MGFLGYRAFERVGWLSVIVFGLGLAFACSSSEPSGGPGDGAGADAAQGGDDAQAGGGSAPANGGKAGAGTAGEGQNGGAAGDRPSGGGAAGEGEGGAGGDSHETATGGDGGSPPNPDPETSFWSLTPHASPLTVTFTRETASRAVKAMPLTGGTLSTTAQDGTQFQLTIPADALLSPETVSMTPVLLSEQPFGDGPAWGVELLPDGLRFNQPVKLVITPPTAAVPAVTEQLPFGWSGTEHEVVLASPDPSDSQLSVQLLHFSSYAYATAKNGVSASLAGVRARIGGSAEARLESALAEVFTKERQRQLLGDPEMELTSTAEVERLAHEFNEQVVEPRIAAAGDSCAAARLALDTMLTFERRNALLGLEITASVTLSQLTETVYSVCLDEEWKLCRDEHIIQRLVPVYLSFERLHELLGGAQAGSDWQAKGLDYIAKCHRFRLEVDSSASSNCDQWSFTETVEGDVALASTGIGSPIMGTGSLVSTDYSMAYSQCTGVSNIVQNDTVLLVNDLGWELKTDPLQPGKGEIADFTLIYFPSPGAGSTHVATDTCGMPPSPPVTIEGFYWSGIYGITTVDNPDYFDETSGWFLKDWQVKSNGGATLAEKDISPVVNDDGIVYGSPTSLVLVHTPG